MLPNDTESLSKLHTVINVTSEEILQYRLNILKSINGHAYVRNETFMKKQRSEDLLQMQAKEVN